MVRPLSVGAASGPPRFLFFPILRTRSARKNLVGGSVIVLLSLLITTGCEDRTPTREPERLPDRPRGQASNLTSLGDPPRRLKQDLERLESEAGIEMATDPAPPSGDLKHDIESFTTLDACVRARATTDPLLGDAIDALGYDTLIRDACRILEALKTKDKERCKPIIASPLRARCESYVATFAGNPNLCPIVESGGKVASRDPVCLARASRDERLCAAALPSDRATCRAQVLGDATECGKDESCVRQVERYKTLLDKPSSHTPFASRIHLDLAAEKGTPDPAVKSFDFDDVAAAGAVVRIAGDKVRVSLGTPKSALWTPWDAPLASPKLFIELSVASKDVPKAPLVAAKNQAASPAPPTELGTGDLTVDLLLPKVASLSALTATDRKLEIAQVATEVGGPVKFVLTIQMREAPRAFDARIEVETFVRDVVGRGSK
jgi:hypothetical protein